MYTDKSDASVPRATRVTMEKGFSLQEDDKTLVIDLHYATKGNGVSLYVTLQKYVSTINTLTGLAFTHGYISSNDIESIGNVLMKSNISCLLIKGTQIDASPSFRESAQKMAALIVNCRQLTKLTINASNIGQTWAEEIANCLANSTLERLNLGNNNINEEGAKDLARALPRATTLKYLSVDYNYINMAGKIALLDAFTLSPHMTGLNLQDQMQTNAGVTAAFSNITYNGCINLRSQAGFSAFSALLRQEPEADDHSMAEIIAGIAAARRSPGA